MNSEYAWIRYALLLLLIPILRMMLAYRSEEEKREYNKIEKCITKKQSRIAWIYFHVYLLGMIVCGAVAMQPYLGTSQVHDFLADFSIAYMKLTIAMELTLGILVLLKKTSYKVNTLAAAKQANCSSFWVRFVRAIGPVLYFVCLIWGKL